MQLRLRVFVLLLLGLSACASSSGAREVPTELTRGEPFMLRLPRVGGDELDLRELRGKVVLVDVWATWCAPCAKSFPFYARLHEELSDQGFEVVAVSVDEREQDVAEWMSSNALPFIVVHDPEGTVPERIGLRTMPTAVLVDREGNVTDVHAGFASTDEPDIERMIRAALSER